ncbi:MAG: GIY-YIG nuclease family protein [Rhodothermaceae bacterium]|nr:GIY-YIG nuclease family protein [Rhodothermaceae bacterium]MYI84564.1 GIY-YIG nuclease family protein [Rhodothermaceae bacterium]
MTDPRPFKIQIFVADGLPEGLRLVSKSNWIGQGIVCPRGRYSQAKRRPEFSQSGVYLLVGQDGDRLPKLYVGEAEKVKNRLDSHYTNKDFWQQAIVFTAKEPPLNKAQVKYLEARLLELAKEHGRSKLENSGSSRRPRLSEADQAETEGFLDELLSLLPVLGVTFFEPDETPGPDHKVYYLEGLGCSAEGLEVNTGFKVLQNSLARVEPVASFKKQLPYHYRQRQELIADGTLWKTDDDDHYHFTKDCLFGSPSAAAAVCLGRSANGLKEWKDKSGTSLKDNRKKETA